MKYKYGSGKSGNKWRSKLFTLNDFLSQLEDEEDTDFASADIFISPQRDRQNSDEDDVNDNVQEEVSANDLPGRQLRSTAEVQAKLRDGSQITLGDDSDAPDKTSSSEEDEAEPSIKSRKKISQSRVCRKEDIRPLENEWVENQPKFLQNMTPNKMFRTLFR
ncbi:hypothetical protein RRG08_008873 [Elysia crispata]|uniref:Uncharacterized protein n=1 Tax=Elysia crispata TaxID=231223 RepID=A0AAE0ZXA7_9GAST|nr:hypothetical protein RRG08_008873 [Elysia crispata]